MSNEPFSIKYGPWALVAGASEGLGAAFARQIASRGVNVVLIARREKPLEALASELRNRYGVEVSTAPMDLSVPDLADRLAAVTEGRDIGLLVYNACYSVIAPFVDTALDDHLKVIDVNCRGPMTATHLMVPRMVARGRGGVVLMSSMSAFQGTAMIASYAASKAYDIVLGEALWDELRGTGVEVLVCAAGATDTPNFRAGTPADKQRGTFPMDPNDVAQGALRQLGKGGPTWVPGRMNRAVRGALSLVPRRLAVRFFSSTTRSIYE